MNRITFVVVIIFVFCIVVKSTNSYFFSDDIYDIYTISTPGLNTKNFYDYLSDVDIIKIYPKVNPIYSEKLGNISYNFTGNNDINIFTKEYLSLIKKNSYSDYNYLYINGIDIERIEIYTSSKDLYKLLFLFGGKIIP